MWGLHVPVQLYMFYKVMKDYEMHKCTLLCIIHICKLT